MSQTSIATDRRREATADTTVAAIVEAAVGAADAQAEVEAADGGGVVVVDATEAVAVMAAGMEGGTELLFHDQRGSCGLKPKT